MKAILGPFFRKIIIFSIFLILLFVPDIGSAKTAECNSCADCTSKLNGEYQTVYLSSSIPNVEGSCITFMANNLVLDCRNNIISGDGKGENDYGIGILGRTGITLKNCQVTGFGYGIFLTASSRNFIMDNKLWTNSKAGILIRNSDVNYISQNVVHRFAGNGIRLENSVETSITKNVVCEDVPSGGTDIILSLPLNDEFDNYCDSVDTGSGVISKCDHACSEAKCTDIMASFGYCSNPFRGKFCSWGKAVDMCQSCGCFSPAECNTYTGECLLTDKDSDGDDENDITDCGPLNPLMHHGHQEICSDGLDNDCDGKEYSCLQMYSPVLYISKGYYGEAFDYEPMNIGSMLQESDLRGPLRCVDWIFGICVEWSTYYDRRPVELSSFIDHDSTDYELDMQDADPGVTETGSEVPAPGRFNKYARTVYGRESDYGEYKVLQYWFFYPYNNYENKHEGDWEMIQVLLDKGTRDLKKITYSWHYGGTTLDWTADDLTLFKGSHPAVYVGEGSHASWWTGGDHKFSFGEGVEDIFKACVEYTDKTDPVKTLIPLRAGLSESDVSGPSKDFYTLTPVSEATDWLQWDGYWGEVDWNIENPATTGPRGPYFSKVDSTYKWRDPVAYANNPMSSYYAICAHSPVTLHIFDSDGNRVGMNESGEFDMNISGLYLYEPSYFSEPENRTIILVSSDNLTFSIEAKEKGEFGFALARYEKGSSTETAALYEAVRIEEETAAKISVGGSNPGYVMEIDTDGDGKTDKTKPPDRIRTSSIPVGGLDESVSQEPLPAGLDTDNDGAIDSGDNCPSAYNPRQSDYDMDDLGDACDIDMDGDAWINEKDSCPLTVSINQSDTDSDHIGDACDNCPEKPNQDQNDTDRDGVGDACETTEKKFIRGNVNGGIIDISDPVFILNYMFVDGPAPDCLDSADVNDDGQIDIADPIRLLNYMFANGPEPNPPFLGEGSDPTEDGLGC